jgi:RNA-binding protein Tab2/Atab2
VQILYCRSIVSIIATEASMTSAPQPLPDHLWGERWQFVGLPAQALEEQLLSRPIPHRFVANVPSQCGLPPDTLIPGIMIEAGRQSMRLARWIAEASPLKVTAMSRELGAVMLTTQVGIQWILTTYSDPEVHQAGKTFEQRKQTTQGLHFLLIQPDDSGVTYSGLWVLGSTGSLF